MKKVLILGNDKISRKAYNILADKINLQEVIICVDKTTDLKRIKRLVLNKSLTFPCLLKMMWAELLRKNYPVIKTDYYIHSHYDLLNLIVNSGAESVFLFRCGLIINKSLLSLGIPFYNVHCASLDGYGGLGSIYKALKNNDLEQSANLHIVTSKIDDNSGIIDSKKYTLTRDKSYLSNENEAYNAGISILIKHLTCY